MEIEVNRLGECGATVVLVHGSLNDGSVAFAAQTALAARWRLVIPNRRGYGRNPPIAKVDVEADARDIVELLGAGAHLAGTSMGGIVAGQAAALAPDRVRSLTLIEPPAFANAQDIAAVAATAGKLQRHWQAADRNDVGGFIRGFLAALGIEIALPDPLPENFVIAARNLMTEAPWQTAIPAAAIARAPYPKAVVSGTSCAAFEAICDRLADQLHAIRRTFPGAGHAVQRIGKPFNSFFEQFLRDAEQARGNG